MRDANTTEWLHQIQRNETVKAHGSKSKTEFLILKSAGGGSQNARLDFRET
jgi:hypothetical protein